MNFHLPTLETERLILRKVTSSDAQDMYEYCSIPEVAMYVPWETHQTIEDSEQFIQFILNQYEAGKLAPWAIEHKETGKMIGTFDFVTWYSQHARAEIGFVLSEKYWGTGIILEAARKVIQYGFTEMNLNIIKASCMKENAQSKRVLEKLGMKLDGVLLDEYMIKGTFRDMAIYSLKKEEEILYEKND
ncbi:GNAT family N-acetyltransferase [Alkalicoccobacillus gibsonii]|uniref:GNAT family N-acetyltransferase n=1 Tax=Alkalicoccobacillus gibsonii TaxID=79881 RepID=UPI00351682E5